MNPVSQSMKDVMPELSSQLTKLNSDVNGHRNTSMDFLCYNFRQINDNVVTVNCFVACTTAVSDMQNFQVFIKV